MDLRKKTIKFLRKAGLTSPALSLYAKYLGLKRITNIKSEDNIVNWIPKTSKRKIFVDVSNFFIQDHRGGIQRVQRSILENWSTNYPNDFEIYPIYFSFDDSHFHYVQLNELSSWRPKHIIPEGIVQISKGDIYLNTDLNYRFSIEYEYFYQELKEHKVSTYFIVYDLLPVSHPELFPEGIGEMHEKWLEVAMRNSTLICISKTVMNLAIEWGSKKDIIVSSTSFDLGYDFSKIMESPKSTIVRDSKTDSIKFLIVSTIEVRKSHELVLDAFEILWNEGLDVELTLVGKPGWKVDHLLQRLRSHRYVNRRLFWFSDLPDERLNAIYGSSSALINASLGEGFGLPLVEASFHGLPLILRDLPVFREIAGENPWYFDTHDEEELARSLRNWIVGYKNGNIGPVTKIKTVTWNDSCEELLDIFNRA
jgi:glycosyltransferase involved in cell wall biosynthesis